MPERNPPLHGEIVTRNGDALGQAAESLRREVSYGQRVGNGERKARAYQKAAEVIELRRQGKSFDQIGRALGVSRQVAYRRFVWGLSHTVKPEEAQAARLLDLDRLDHCISMLYPITQGEKVVTESQEDGTEVQRHVPYDTVEQLAAIKTMIEVVKQRGRLFNYDDTPRPDDESLADAQTKAAVMPLLKGMTDEELADMRELYERVVRRQRGPSGQLPPPPTPGSAGV